jgi:hypothetical protein
MMVLVDRPVTPASDLLRTKGGNRSRLRSPSRRAIQRSAASLYDSPATGMVFRSQTAKSE